MTGRRIRMDNPDDWPVDLADHVFLGRALDGIGAALFKTEWATADLFANDHLRLGELWNKAHGFSKISEDQISEHEQLKESLKCAEARVNDAHHKAHHWLITGLLPSFYMVPNGRLHQMDNADWNSNAWREKLISFFLEIDDDYGEPAFYCPIYVCRDTLAKRLLDLQDGRIDAEIGGYASPFLRTMLDVTRHLDISPQNQPRKSAVKQAIRKAWKGAHRLSDKKVATMARLILDPRETGDRHDSPA